MNMALPDVAQTDFASVSGSLDWVGMEGIDLPVTLEESQYRRTLQAKVDVLVDLPLPEKKGIHMSRLYQLLEEVGEEDCLSPAGLKALLQAMIDSHHDCGCHSAKLRFEFGLLVRRPALVSEGLSGWKSYPVCIDAQIRNGVFSTRASVEVAYSSTCPCSASLARQKVEQGFRAAFKSQESVTTEVAAVWLRQHATLATPHSQRSEALVAIEVPAESTRFGLLALIDRTEKALGTPVQTAVKRSDEQAFAELNGQNLMFVEDAARRLKSTLGQHYNNPSVCVRHLESLHAHDAVAMDGRD